MTPPETDTKTRDEAAEEDERGERGPRNLTGVVLKGAAVGGAAGAAIGAWAAFARATWPDQIEKATRAVSDTVGDVGRAAARAAAQTVDPEAVAGLLPGNDDRTEVVKRTARDAATAAARAAREAISTMSEGANGSKSARKRKEGA